MEYPMLITVGTTWWMPAGLHIPEIVTVHELGHQYWYAAVATDEVNEPWLDEGITTYVEGLIMDDVYGPQRSYIDLFGIRAGSTAVNRLLYLKRRQLGSGRQAVVCDARRRQLSGGRVRQDGAGAEDAPGDARRRRAARHTARVLRRVALFAIRPGGIAQAGRRAR
jgi:hypothetical protein